MGQVQFISPRIGGDWSITCRSNRPVSLLTIARLCHVPLPVDCTQGLCGACAVRVVLRRGALYRRLGLFEKRTLLAIGKVPLADEGEDSTAWKGPRWRLACQCMVENSDQFFVAF